MKSLINRFQTWLGGVLGGTKSVAAHANSTTVASQIDHEDIQNVVLYDENLLERARTQWQFGDWASHAQPTC